MAYNTLTTILKSFWEKNTSGISAAGKRDGHSIVTYIHYPSEMYGGPEVQI